MDRIGLSAGELSLELQPETGGAIARFDLVDQKGRRPLLRAAPDRLNDVLDAGCFPLVPFSNRVRDGRFSFRGREVCLSPNMPPQKHPLHGQGWRNPWDVVAAERACAELAYRHAPGEWPWAYEARQRFQLDPDGLSVELSVRNLSDEAMPAGLGLHPYFPCDGETVLDAQVRSVWTVDEEVMPVQEVPAEGRYSLDHRRICGQDLDNGFAGWSGAAALDWPADRVGVDIRCVEAGFFQVYSPKDGGLFVAEPVTHRNGALNLPESAWKTAGLRVLDPGQSMTLPVRFAVPRG